ncbi:MULTISPECIES: endonuclease/exonuclease/phosphatase family protein [Paenibacillus]|uniref:Endonuclease/exonuclease/phosphatase domain-containing protein n=1 Tax=Paenibacillus lautus TaxID=1401 RepID=A0A1R1B4H8_PAELA|nr:endonuclease/exonuclease/phosphatase family protein [Paenibacillus lautus]OME93862.1 hypothetical protein BK123_11510 [Paenibacillus lautus]
MMVCTLQALFHRHKQVRIAVVVAVCNTAVKLLSGFSTPALAKANVTSVVHEETVDLTVMTFNIRLGGGVVSFDQTAETIRTAGADIVGIQEPGGNLAALAQKLGFYYAEGHNIMSRFPIINAHQREYVYIEVRPGKVVAMSNVHLSAYPYGPYDIRDGKSVHDVLSNEKKYHMAEMKSRFEVLPNLASRGLSVFLTGDFNVPSHLDWTNATKSNHYGVSIQWPVSAKLQQLNFRDSYREIRPNPVTHPANTWTPGENGQIGTNEVHDRIDFVYASGPSTTLGSKIVGENGPYSDIVLAPWPSDHRAIVSTFRAQLAPTPDLPNGATICTDKPAYAQEETVLVTYTSASVSKDWIGIYQEGIIPGIGNPSIVWKYASEGQPPNGTISFDSLSLSAGTYDAILLADDGYTELARTTFTIGSNAGR